MLDITLLAVGKIKDKNLSALAQEYLKRLRPFARLKVVELPAVAFSSALQTKAKELEGEKIENFLEKNPDALCYLLSERGEMFDSLTFATWLEKKSPLILVIAGSLGFSPFLVKKYPKLSLSALTFPHELARVILLEQIYRAATILQHKNYHY